MKFGWIFAGLIMLFLPNVALYDLLPDFIGYLFLLKGISQWADLSLDMEGAKRSFLKLSYLGIFKTLTLLLLVGVRSYLSAYDEGYMGLFTWVFGGLETVFFITGFHHFFDGMENLATRHGIEIAEKRTTDLRTITCIFILVKSVLAGLAEVDTLFGEGVTLEAGGGTYGRLLLIANLLLTTIVGTIWLCMMLRYLSEVRANTAFCEQVNARYDEQIRPNTALFLQRRIKFAFLLFGGGMFCMIDLTVSGINIIPDAMGALLFLGGMAALYREKLFPKVLFLPIGVWFGAALAEEIVSAMLYSQELDRIDTYGVTEYPEIFAKFLASSLLSTLTAALFLFAMIAFARIFQRIVLRHTGMLREAEDTHTKERNAVLHKELFLHIRIFVILSAIYAASCVANAWLVPFLRIYWLIHAVLGIIWVFHSAKFLSMLFDQIEHKYL